MQRQVYSPEVRDSDAMEHFFASQSGGSETLTRFELLEPEENVENLLKNLAQ